MITEFQRLQNIAKITFLVKQKTGVQEQPIAPGRGANPRGEEVHTENSIFILDGDELIECPKEYQSEE